MPSHLIIAQGVETHVPVGWRSFRLIEVTGRKGENDASADDRYECPAIRSNCLCALEPASCSRGWIGSRQLTDGSSLVGSMI
jgi:hypothetical protein